MGALQTYQWATQYPDFMDLIVPFCGAAKTSLHNQVFLEGVKSALLAAKGVSSAGSAKGEALAKAEDYRPWTAEEKSIGLKAFGRGYAGWGFSQAFYRERAYEKALGFKDLEDFMVNFWETWAGSKGNILGATFAGFRIADAGRSRESPCDAPYVAGRRLLGPGAVQWGLCESDARHQGQSSGTPGQNRPLLSVSCTDVHERVDG